MHLQNEGRLRQLCQRCVNAVLHKYVCMHCTVPRQSFADAKHSFAISNTNLHASNLRSVQMQATTSAYAASMPETGKLLGWPDLTPLQATCDIPVKALGLSKKVPLSSSCALSLAMLFNHGSYT